MVDMFLDLLGRIRLWFAGDARLAEKPLTDEPDASRRLLLGAGAASAVVLVFGAGATDAEAHHRGPRWRRRNSRSSSTAR